MGSTSERRIAFQADDDRSGIGPPVPATSSPLPGMVKLTDYSIS